MTSQQVCVASKRLDAKTEGVVCPAVERRGRPASIMLRKRQRRFIFAEQLESRCMLAVGPVFHTHNQRDLAIVDGGTGELAILDRFSGFAEGDDRMSDIAFGPDSRLYGIGASHLYDIDPVTAELTTLGAHGIPRANALVFSPTGQLRAMGPEDGKYYQLTVNDNELVDVRVTATVSGLDPGVGSGGDIAFINNELILATSDNRLIWYRFDIQPNRPRIVKELDLSDVGITGNIFGLAVVGDQQLIGTGQGEVFRFDLSNDLAPTAEVISVSNQSFGDLRGAAYYAEAGGGVPIGTIAGVKWRDNNGDGQQQRFLEPGLSGWEVYIDVNLNGAYDNGEPRRRTDDHGRYYFYGVEPGVYTVDEIIPDSQAWEQTHPRTPNRNLVGVYQFESTSTQNSLFHGFGLPDLTAVGVNLPGTGTASMATAASYLELPMALGDEPFTIAMNAEYRTNILTNKYLISQRAGEESLDFRLITEANSRDVAAEFCKAADRCATAVSAPVEDKAQSYAITWDGVNVGSFSDDALVITSVAGTQSSLQGDAVRIGNPTGADRTPLGAQGRIHEIRIYNKALTEAELDRAFFEVPRPGAYTVYVDDTRGVSGLDFGNKIREIVVVGPEIEVRLDRNDGPQISNNETIDLGRVASVEDAPEKEFWIHNVGNETLTLTIDESAGFAVAGQYSTTVEAGDLTSFLVVVSDNTPGIKNGSIVINNNDADEDPFVIDLTAEIVELDTRARDIMINTSAGHLLKINRSTGAITTLMTGLPSLSDIAHHPTEDRLYGIDATWVYEFDRVAGRVETRFVHNIPQANALGFSPLGDLFAAGQDVYRLDLDAGNAEMYATGGAGLAGDLAGLGSRMIMSTLDGGLYEVEAGASSRIADVTSDVALTGLVSLTPTSLMGFSEHQTYQINVVNGALSPRFNRIVFNIAGATYQPEIKAYNTLSPYDVDGNGVVTPLDALLIINELNDPTFTDPSGRLVGRPTGATKYPDVDNNGFVVPFDALSVINFLNTDARPVVAAATDEGVETLMRDAEGELSAASLASDLAAALVYDEVHKDRKSKRGH